MTSIPVKVQRDHLETLARARSPLDAIAELIWNGLDADARTVRIRLEENSMDGVESISVSDDGHGLPIEDAKQVFGKLGGSWKTKTHKTRNGRLLHGKLGKGRFRAFALGDSVTWRTAFKDNRKLWSYSITGSRSNLEVFEVSEPEQSTAGRPGTEVIVTDLLKGFRSLTAPDAAESLTEQFALYLRQYSDVTIYYDGVAIDPSSVESSVTEYELESMVLSEGQTVDGALTVIEWLAPNRRALYLCDGDGFALHEIPPRIHAPGFSFTAYLKCGYLRQLEADGAFILDELHPDLQCLMNAAKDQLRIHFRQRSTEKAAEILEDWKRQDVYPYRDEPRDVIEEVERQVFDVLALNVNAYLPHFEDADSKNKRFAFGLLREAITSSPTSLQKILKDVLELPEGKQEELAEILQRTSLEAIINASKLVADRLNFLMGLELLVFEEPSRSRLLERRQLHRILADHTWVFGEEFNLSVDDRSLTKVLEKHLSFLERQVEEGEPVLREDGSEGIVDLMLSRLIPQPQSEEREHLVVELKRPTCKIDDKAMSQIQSYARAVVNDERFRDTRTRWVFWAISNEMTDSVRSMSHQSGRPAGVYFRDDQATVWVKTWGELIQECKARLRFFQDQLKYAADEDSALAYLRAAHEKYLPKELQRG